MRFNWSDTPKVLLPTRPSTSTKNFNTCTIITILDPKKGNLSHKNVIRCTDRQDRSTAMLYNVFQSDRHPKNAPSYIYILHPRVIHVPWTHPTLHSKLHLHRFSHFFTTHNSVPILYLQCPLKAINARLQQLIAAVNKINGFTALLISSMSLMLADSPPDSQCWPLAYL